jgi:mannose-6-phosphate isomerase
VASTKPYRLIPTAYEKVWGSTQLEPWFPNSDKKMGEFWFHESGSPLLIKFLFTTENLSVQVHPNDDQAAHLEAGSAGKTEMWHILKAGPNAKLAMGLKTPLMPDELRAACTDGSIMEHLRWLPARAGDTWFIPAGTIHAIGADITVAEIQQFSDVTYRLYDYGRPRELHLEKGLAVSEVNSRPEAAGDVVCCTYFHTQVIHLDGFEEVGPGYMIVVDGTGELFGQPICQGQVWHLLGKVLIAGKGCVIVTEEGKL